MFHEDILYILYLKYIKTSFLIINMHGKELHLNNFKGDFLNIVIFLHPQIFKYCPINGILFIQLSGDV